MKKAFLWWWLSICVTAVAILVAIVFGGFEHLWASDQTKISLGILTLFALTTSWIGYVFARLCHTASDSQTFTDLHNTLDMCWFSADTSVTLGLIGTVVGFMLMLGPAFDGINVADHQVAQAAISSMASGMSTALITTFCGLACGQHIKKQLVLLEHGIKSI